MDLNLKGDFEVINEYEYFGQLTYHRNQFGYEEWKTYGDCGLIKHIDSNNYSYTKEYNELGKCCHQFNSFGWWERYDYKVIDGKISRVRMYDSEGNNSKYVYDSQGELLDIKKTRK